jgi:hypothetical protein
MLGVIVCAGDKRDVDGNGWGVENIELESSRRRKYHWKCRSMAYAVAWMGPTHHQQQVLPRFQVRPSSVKPREWVTGTSKLMPPTPLHCELHPGPLYESPATSIHVYLDP